MFKNSHLKFLSGENVMSSHETSLAKISHLNMALEGQGVRNLPWKTVDENSIEISTLNLDWLTSQPLLPYLVQVIPTITLHQSLQLHGMEDAIEIVEWIRGPQLRKMFDLDIWNIPLSADQSPDVSGEQFVRWIGLWNEIDPTFAAKRFQELEEEVITLLISKILDIVPIGFYKFTDAEADSYWKTNDDRFYLRMKPEFEGSFDQVHGFLESLYRMDIRFAQNVLAASSLLVRDESLESGLHWREARLADAGFVSTSEAQQLLSYKKFEKVVNDIKRATTVPVNKNKTPQVLVSRFNDEIDPELVDTVYGTLLQANPEESARDIHRILGGEEIKLIVGSETPSDEMLLADNDAVASAAEKIVAQCQRLLAINEASSSKRSSELLIDKVISALAEESPDVLNQLKGALVRISNTVAAAFTRKFSSDLTLKSLATVRGAVNVGLEILVQDPTKYGLAPVSGDEVASAKSYLHVLDAAHVFRLGWSRIAQTTSDALNELSDIGLKNPQLKFLAQNYSMTFDGKSVDVTPLKLLESNRFLELRAWLHKFEASVPQSAFVILSAFVNRLPLYPEVLSRTAPTLKDEFNMRPFESMSDVSNAEKFIRNLERVLS